MEIFPGIHRIEAPLGRRYVAMYLILGDRGALLVDTGVRDSVDVALVNYLDRLSMNPQDISYVVSTHCDFDHVGGNAALRARAPEAVFLCHELDRYMAEDVERVVDERYDEFWTTDGHRETPESRRYILDCAEATPFDRCVENGETLDVGGRRVRVLHVPGHSDGHLAVLDETSGSMCIGDAVLGRSVNNADGSPAFPPTYRRLGPYLASIAALRGAALSALLPAHYPVFREDEIERFLGDSVSFTEDLDRELRLSLPEHDEGMGTMDLVRMLSARLGTWDPEAGQNLVYPLVGHLEELQSQSSVRVTIDQDGHRRWFWSE